MPYLSDFDQDVLICFAEEDNQPLSGTGDQGWANGLGQLVAKLVGTHGIAGDIMIRTILPGNLPREDRLRAIDKSATVIVLMSPAFIESSWMRDADANTRLVAFAEKVPLRTFLVIKSEVEEASVPEAVWNLKHRVFWRLQEGSPLTIGLINPSQDQAFLALANDLAYAVASQLRDLKRKQNGHSPAPSGPAVFLAEVTPDLLEKRAEIERFLEQRHIDVRPRGHLPSEAARTAEALVTEMANANVFVQLLSESPLHAGSESRPSLQLTAALARSNMRILQWRDPGLNVSALESNELAAMLLRPTVRAESTTDFQQAILDAMQPDPTQQISGSGPIVFVDAQPEDDIDLQRIFGGFRNKAQWDWHDAKRLAELKMVCEIADAVLVFWGSGESGRSQQRYYQFLKYWRAKKKHESRLRIFDGPPPQKPVIQGVGLPVIRCRDGSQNELVAFINKLNGM